MKVFVWAEHEAKVEVEMNFTWALKDATLSGQETESYAQATGLPSNMNNEWIRDVKIAIHSAQQLPPQYLLKGDKSMYPHKNLCMNVHGSFIHKSPKPGNNPMPTGREMDR